MDLTFSESGGSLDSNLHFHAEPTKHLPSHQTILTIDFKSPSLIIRQHSGEVRLCLPMAPRLETNFKFTISLFCKTIKKNKSSYFMSV